MRLMKYLFLAIVFISCRNNSSCPDKMTDENKTIKFLALGDSYTIGEKVLEPLRWPNQLQKSLNELNIEVENPIIIAKTGWTTDELLQGINQENPQGTFDMVSLLIGVNNQYRGRDTSEYRIQFRELLELAIEFTGDNSSNVIVVSIPDWGVTPFAQGRDQKLISRQIDYFNKINYSETIKKGSQYVDITDISRKAEDDITLLAEDQLHPSGKMYSEWVQKILPYALSILRK